MCVLYIIIRLLDKWHSIITIRSVCSTHIYTHAHAPGDRYSQEPRSRSLGGSHYDEDPRGPIDEYSDKPKESSNTEEEESSEYTSVKQEDDTRYRR